MSWLSNIAERFRPVADNQETVSASSLDYYRRFDQSSFDGEKFPGGLSDVNALFGLDYWGLRRRSAKLYETNAYARGIIRRIVTNVITTGLHLEAIPDESIIGLKEDALAEWAENIETRYYIYGETPEIVDYRRARNMGEIQRTIKTEALVSGDCLVVLRQHPKFKLPTVQIIPGDRVQTPYNLIADKNIVDGVELDVSGRHLAYFVVDDKNPLGYTKVLARGKNTGRPQAKLIYGCDKREDGVRGVPFLGIAIQPLAEIDRYRDSAQRKATLNSMYVAFIKRDPNFKGKKSSGVGKGAQKRGTNIEVVDDLGKSATIPFADMIPGIGMFGLNGGEEPVLMGNNGVDINFGAFEATILMGLAWALEIPPEVLLLSFNKNYSASQAAINEFKMYLEKEREKFGTEFCDFLYQDWFLSMSLLGKIDSGSYMVDNMDAMRWDAARAWTMAEWSGQMKPSTDLAKSVKAYKEAIAGGLITYGRSTRELFGMKFSRNVKQLLKEEEQLARINTIRNSVVQPGQVDVQNDGDSNIEDSKTDIVNIDKAKGAA